MLPIGFGKRKALLKFAICKLKHPHKPCLWQLINILYYRNKFNILYIFFTIVKLCHLKQAICLRLLCTWEQPASLFSPSFVTTIQKINLLIFGVVWQAMYHQNSLANDKCWKLLTSENFHSVASFNFLPRNDHLCPNLIYRLQKSWYNVLWLCIHVQWHTAVLKTMASAKDNKTCTPEKINNPSEKSRQTSL